MKKVMRALVDNDLRGILIVHHVPQMVGDLMREERRT